MLTAHDKDSSSLCLEFLSTVQPVAGTLTSPLGIELWKHDANTDTLAILLLSGINRHLSVTQQSHVSLCETMAV